MVESRSNGPWFEFRIEQTEGPGVEIEKLTRVLQELRGAFLALARARLGKASRPGPHTHEEQLLSSIRIMRVSPGSAIIEAEPPTLGLQGPLTPLGNEPTADDVAYDLLQEMDRIQHSERSIYSSPEVRRRVHALVRSAGEVGRVAEAVHRPRKRVGDINPDSVARARLNTDELEPEVLPEVIPEPRRRRVSGRAYMVDVEPGRWRIRVKLPDGRDLTLDASPELATVMRQAVDRVVEIESIEELVGDEVSSRTAVNLQLLPSAGPGNSQPPKTVAELAVEQGMPQERPNYESLATAVWENEEDLADFERHLAQIRQTA